MDGRGFARVQHHLAAVLQLAEQDVAVEQLSARVQIGPHHALEVLRRGGNAGMLGLHTRFKNGGERRASEDGTQENYSREERSKRNAFADRNARLRFLRVE